MKLCKTCGECKPLDQFHRRADRPGGAAARCKACKAAWVKTYRAEKIEQVRARSREWHHANKARSVANTRAWQRANPGWGTANAKAYEMAKRRAIPPWANRSAIAAVYRAARAKSRETGEPWHVDHIVPIQSPIVCGLHVEANLRLLPALDNILKSNTWDFS